MKGTKLISKMNMSGANLIYGYSYTVVDEFVSGIYDVLIFDNGQNIIKNAVYDYFFTPVEARKMKLKKLNNENKKNYSS
jgi:hypothetical protein